MATGIQNFSARVTSAIQKSNWGISTIIGLNKQRNERSYFTYSRELCHVVDHEPKWVSADEAVKCITSGNTVFMSGAAATPIDLAEAMTKHGKANKLKDITVCHMHTEGPASYAQPDCEGIFRSLSFFMAGNVRQAVADGRSDAIPIFLQDIPSLFHKKIVKPDVAMVHVSPPDQHGFCSLGTSVDCVKAGVQNSRIVIAQVNKNMPRTFGDSVVHMSHFDYAVNVDTPLPSHPSGAGSPEETAIGKHIAENLVEDGATLQMGIGSIPDAVLALLENHKDLGIHTEMFAMGVVNLVKKGAVTNGLKPIHRGKIVSSFLIGTKELYDFVNNNPSVLMKEVDYTNSTAIIRQHPKMTSINSCIEVDITGQVCADSIGTRMFSGFGGQVDFHRGAAEGVDGKGKAIIALQSMNKKTRESKIVPFLKQGAGVVTTRAHINYIVTEHGIAHLFGKNLRQRAHALINVSHPDHREALEKAAFERLKAMPCP
uniref:4-hydroxybutyrate Co-A transferase n=1 Tax=Riptortus pedestris TaxID=329032 RepID=R4WDF0_RIPPE|nr:4-hydroxybutyrate Co-A transferase [Riptortus pedestris]